MRIIAVITPRIKTLIDINVTLIFYALTKCRIDVTLWVMFM